jgi:hypothetical protein
MSVTSITNATYSDGRSVSNDTAEHATSTANSAGILLSCYSVQNSWAVSQLMAFFRRINNSASDNTICSSYLRRKSHARRLSTVVVEYFEFRRFRFRVSTASHIFCPWAFRLTRRFLTREGTVNDSYICSIIKKQTPWPSVRKRTIPTERPPLVDEVSANFCG